MTGEPVMEAAPAFGAFLPVLGPPPWYPRPEEQMPASGRSQGQCVWVLGALGLRHPSCPFPALSGVITPGTPGPSVPSAFPEAPRSCSLRGGGRDLCAPVPPQPGQDRPVPLCRPRSPGFPPAHRRRWRWRGRCPWAGSGCSERGGSGQRPHRSGCAARCGGCRSAAGSRARGRRCSCPGRSRRCRRRSRSGCPPSHCRRLQAWTGLTQCHQELPPWGSLSPRGLRPSFRTRVDPVGWGGPPDVSTQSL